MNTQTKVASSEGELRSPELIAGGTGPSQGPERMSASSDGELRSPGLVARGAGPFEGSGIK